VDIESFISGKYLKAADVDPPVTDLVTGVKPETMPGESTPKYVVYLQSLKPWVLNVTNAKVLAEAWGTQTETWPGRQVELFALPVSYQGKTVQGIRCRIPQAPQQAPPAPAPPAPTAPQPAPGAQAPWETAEQQQGQQPSA